jgi:hypothetical protein
MVVGDWTNRLEGDGDGCITAAVMSLSNVGGETEKRVANPLYFTSVPRLGYLDEWRLCSLGRQACKGVKQVRRTHLSFSTSFTSPLTVMLCCSCSSGRRALPLSVTVCHYCHYSKVRYLSRCCPYRLLVERTRTNEKFSAS